MVFVIISKTMWSISSLYRHIVKIDEIHLAQVYSLVLAACKKQFAVHVWLCDSYVIDYMGN